MENLTLNILNVLTIFVSITASAEQIKIAVIDTGYTKPVGMESVNLCKDGHYDASNQTNVVGADETVNGSSGHGTNIAHIIDDKLKRFGKNKYCIVIFKVYGGSRNLIEMSIDALDKINKSDIKYVNYSTAGEGFDKKESEIGQNATSESIKNTENYKPVALRSALTQDKYAAKNLFGSGTSTFKFGGKTTIVY
jgi:hypothetical protein